MDVRILVASSTAIALIAFVRALPSPVFVADGSSHAKPEIGTFGFNVDGMDRSATPGDDFVRYAVGKWLDSTEIPADRSSWNSVAVIKAKASERVRSIIQNAAKASAPEGSDTGKIGDYFTAFMDEARIERLGADPLKPELQAIAAIHTRKDL